MFELEVLELNENCGVPVLDGGDELVHKLVILLAVHPFLLDTEVIGIVQQALVVCSDIQNDGEYVSGMESSPRYVQVEFADRNAEASAAEVAQAQHTAPISDHDRLHIGFWPVVHDRRHL